jgi:uncharacterized protein (TIGR02145 family)
MTGFILFKNGYMKVLFMSTFILTVLGCGNAQNNNQSNIKNVDYSSIKFELIDSIKCVRIGNQIWMLENLSTDTYQNGDKIPEISDGEKWSNSETGAWCNYENKPDNGVIYGKLYNYAAISDSRNIAPKGWHVADLADWTRLAQFLGGFDIAGTKMKFIESNLWDKKCTTGNNSSSFCALPGGLRNSDNGSFFGVGSFAKWWCCDTVKSFGFSPSTAELICGWDNLKIQYVRETFGVYVRCVKD